MLYTAMFELTETQVTMERENLFELARISNNRDQNY